ncbi:MAG TPA: hypothetical protein VM386_06820 [Acidimicrobiales bacterium]|nr:hypothetical protein [Acidimicrobiales bacterium]
MKGKWAQGMAPRSFAWVLKDRLAICERPGGYGPSHRRVRRTEEIVWLKVQGFTTVVSTLAAPHNLHAYDEADLPWRHVPFARLDSPATVLGLVYTQLRALLDTGERVVLHHDEVGDRVQGVVTGYLLYAGLVHEPARATAMVERLLQRPMGPLGRELVAVATTLEEPRER